MARNKYKEPTFQLVIQVGNFPHIKYYFVSAVQYMTREGTIAAGEKLLKAKGYDPSHKYIHTRHVWRGTNLELKKPKTEQELTKRNRESPNVEYWIHEKRLRKQLGITATY